MYAQAQPEGRETFRDSISTISKDGGRAWIYPKKPEGNLYRNRTIVGYILLICLFAWPFLKINGHPLMLFNVIERKFFVFGIPFWPQDFFLFVLALITFIVFIILFTAVFGRIWCGWACPQTIFMEIIFRRIEYWIEGDSSKQLSLDKAPWNTDKVLKKLAKHSIFFILSFIIANTFLSYIIGFDQVKLLAIDGPGAHMVGFSALLIFTGVFYGVYARFREQACLVVCPYGRLQGVLLDRNSVVIAYDYLRGEPRKKITKNEQRQSGDCVDCKLCVNVCPTGIDIRNGTQLECINCSACIDACNGVMKKVGFNKGLIRYTSENTIASKEKFKITPRIIGYSIVLLVLLTTLTTLLAFRTDLETTIMRVPGQLYQKVGEDKVSNLYNIQVVNKTFKDMNVEIKLKKPTGEIKFVGTSPNMVKKESMFDGIFFLTLPLAEIKNLKNPVYIDILSEGKVIKEIKTNFLGPNAD
jgi:cytochrome c oxidase accessory protein FixG